MGSRGVTARESDCGLDYLIIATEKCLKPINFKYFDVKDIMDTLKNHITDAVRREHISYLEDKEDVQEYIDANLPQKLDAVVLLIAECLSKYHQNGEFILYDYEANTERKITEFIYTDNILDDLLKALNEMLGPEHWEYKSWIRDSDRKEWISHMKMMCDSLVSLKGGN